MHLSIRFTPLALAVLLWAGCATPRHDIPPTAPVRAELIEARALYNAGRLTEALIACVDIEHLHPRAPGLAELQADIMTAIAARREARERLRRADTVARGLVESEEDARIPDTYGLRRVLEGDGRSHVRQPGKTEALLDRTLTLHFDSVRLSDIITYLGEQEQINLIADPGLVTPPVTIHAENITLRELFEYLSRNMNVSFNLGRGVIWITPAQEPRSTTPLHTRLYRLRTGLPTRHLTEEGAVTEELPLIDALTRFVPTPEGADMLFDANTQMLLVKNTGHNLGMVDRIVDAMDVSPPQVLIEARFINTNISDLRELGVDWLLQSDLELSDENGQTRTRLDSGATIGFGEAVNAGEGFNGTFTGILTDPQFQAVLHALELKSDARTLSAPKVIAVNNRPSFIRIGRDLAYVSDVDITRESYGTGEDRNELLIRDPVVETLETGYQLEATPSVGRDRRDINLRLRPEIVELIRFREITQTIVNTNQTGTSGTAADALPFGGIEFPELARSLIETEVVVQSGETVVMGGLMRQREQENVRGVPLLSSLPILGKLFSRTSVTQEKENLLVFVTATLISQRGEDLVPLERHPPPDPAPPGNPGDVDGTIPD